MPLIDHVKKAWYNAVLPQATSEEQNSADFRHYFLGWPMHKLGSQKTGSDLLFNILRAILGTLTVPLYVTIKRVPEFVLFNLLEESFAWLEGRPKKAHGDDSFSLWAIPKYLLKGVRMLFRAFVSPVALLALSQSHLDRDEKTSPAEKGKLLSMSFMSMTTALMVIFSIVATFLPPLALAMGASILLDLIVLPQLGEFDSILKLFSDKKKIPSDKNVRASDDKAQSHPTDTPVSKLLEEPEFHSALFDDASKNNSTPPSDGHTLRSTRSFS